MDIARGSAARDLARGRLGLLHLDWLDVVNLTP